LTTASLSFREALAMPFRSRKKNILENLFISVLSHFKKYHPSGNMKFNNLGIFSKLKTSYFNGKKSSIFFLSKFYYEHFKLLLVNLKKNFSYPCFRCKYHPSGYLKFNNLGIFLKLKIS